MSELHVSAGDKRERLRIFGWFFRHRGFVQTNETMAYRASSHPRNLLASAKFKVNAQAKVTKSVKSSQDARTECSIRIGFSRSSNCAGRPGSPERLDSVEFLVWSANNSVKHILESGVDSSEVLLCLLERERELRWYKHRRGTWLVGNRCGSHLVSVHNGYRLLCSASPLWCRWFFD